MFDRMPLKRTSRLLGLEQGHVRTITMIRDRRTPSIEHKTIDSEKGHNYRPESFIAKQYQKRYDRGRYKNGM